MGLVFFYLIKVIDWNARNFKPLDFVLVTPVLLSTQYIYNIRVSYFCDDPLSTADAADAAAQGDRIISSCHYLKDIVEEGVGLLTNRLSTSCRKKNNAVTVVKRHTSLQSQTNSEIRSTNLSFYIFKFCKIFLSVILKLQWLIFSTLQSLCFSLIKTFQ